MLEKSTFHNSNNCVHEHRYVINVCGRTLNYLYFIFCLFEFYTWAVQLKYSSYREGLVLQANYGFIKIIHFKRILTEQSVTLVSIHVHKAIQQSV